MAVVKIYGGIQLISHEYESLGGSPILSIDTENDTIEFDMNKKELGEFIEYLQGIYDESKVTR